MTRAEICAEYKVEDGRIVSPGKFEGSPIYAPHFYQAYLDGLADDDDGEVLTFEISDADRAGFPELAEVDRVTMTIDGNGFVWVDARAAKRKRGR